jgi:hypothetical protein
VRLSRWHGRLPPQSLESGLDRARRGVSGALSLAIRFSKAEFRSEGLATGVSTPREVLTVRSRATQARESGQVRKEAALSGNYGCHGSALPEPNSMDTPGDFVSEADARSTYYASPYC